MNHLITQCESYTKEIWTCWNQPQLLQFIEQSNGNGQVFIEYSEDPLKATNQSKNSLKLSKIILLHLVKNIGHF